MYQHCWRLFNTTVSTKEALEDMFGHVSRRNRADMQNATQMSVERCFFHASVNPRFMSEAWPMLRLQPGDLLSSEATSYKTGRGTYLPYVNTKTCESHKRLKELIDAGHDFERVETKKNPNKITSCDPHHDIYPFCYWQIFWHSIWHTSWHSIWHIFWHSTWHIFWHSIWHIFWHIIWQIFWHSIWQTLWHFIWHIFWHSIWHIFWHSIWHIFWHSIWHIFWHSIWHIFWHFIWHIFWHSIWHSIWHIFWHSIWPLRSSGAHWAGKVPGWGPAVRTELGRSQVEVQRCALSWEGPMVEVQRCALSWEGPRLRSSSAHWARKLAKSLAKNWQGGSGGGSWFRHGRGETGGGGGGEGGGGGGGQQLW